MKEIAVNGRIATLTRARKHFDCKECRQPINPGTDYFAVVIAGGGVSSLAHPDRVHQTCVLKFLDKIKRRH